MDKNKEFPSFWFALLILFFHISLQIIISIIAYDIGFGFEVGDPAASGFVMVLSSGIVLSFLLGYKKLSYRQLFNQSSSSLSSMLVLFIIPLLLATGGAVFWISDITNLLLLYYPISENEYQIFTSLMSSGLTSVIVICLIAPFIEEMIFRGIFLRGFLSNYSALNSILLSSFLFALFHLNMFQIPVAFILGCFFGWLYVRTRSLWPSIFGHALYNSFAMLSWPSSDLTFDQQSQMMVEFNSLDVIVASITASVLGILILWYILRPIEAVDTESDS